MVVEKPQETGAPSVAGGFFPTEDSDNEYEEDDEDPPPSGPMSLELKQTQVDLCVPDPEAGIDEIAEGLYVAFRRIRSMRSPPPGPIDLKAGWGLALNVSPFWVTQPRKWWEGKQGVPYTGFLNRDWRAPFPIDELTFKSLLDAKLGVGYVRRTAQADRSDLPQSMYIKFCVARGLCGTLGPHEKPEAGDVLRYSYPSGSLDVAVSELEALLDASPLSPKADPRHLAAHEAAMVALGHETIRVYDARMTTTRAISEQTAKSDGTPAEFAQAAIALSGRDVTRVDTATGRAHPDVVDGQEPARAVSWAPVTRPVGAPGDENDYNLDLSEDSLHICRAAVLEHLIAFLGQTIKGRERRRLNPTDEDLRRNKTLRAMAATVKLKQLRSLGHVARMETTSRSSDIMLEPEKRRYLVTRPPVACVMPAFGKVPAQTSLLYPPDAGLCQFAVRLDPKDPDADKKWDRSGPTTLWSERAVIAGQEPEGFDTGDLSRKIAICGENNYKQAVVLTSWLRDIEGGAVNRLHETEDGIEVDGELSPRPLADVYIGEEPEYTPFERPRSLERRRWGGGARVDPKYVKVETLRSLIAASLSAMRELEQVENEGKLLERVRTVGSKERKHLFGLSSSSEVMSRDRRGGMWQEALREIAVSQDKLFIFVRQLSGGLNEPADQILVGEDVDLAQRRKAIADRHSEITRRSMNFQSRLIETVFSGLFKSSTLSLDLTEEKGGGGLLPGRAFMVRSSDAKEAIKQAAVDSARPFFESNVNLQQLVTGGVGDVPLVGVMQELLHVGNQFHKTLTADLELVNASSISREQLSMPRNAYMIRLNDTVTTAINDTFLELKRRLQRNHWHMMRNIYLWELIEGPSPMLTQSYAALVRSQIQRTRANDTSAVQYVNNQVRNAINFNLEVQYRRVIEELCCFVTRFQPPTFNIPDRTLAPPPIRGNIRGPPSKPFDPSGAPPPPPDEPADPEILRRMYAYKSRKLAERNARARTGIKAARLTGGGLERRDPQPEIKTTNLERGSFLSRFARTKTKYLVRVYRKLVHYLPGKMWRSPPTFGALKDPCKDFYNHFEEKERLVAIEACEQFGKLAQDANAGRELIYWHEWRWKPNLPTTRQQDGKDVYAITFDTTNLPADIQADPALISRALNHMFELPDEAEDIESHEKGELTWTRTGQTSFLWTRRVWKGDKDHRETHDVLMTWLNDVCLYFGKRPGRNAVGLLMTIMTIALLAQGYRTMDAGSGLSGYSAACYTVLSDACIGTQSFFAKYGWNAGDAVQEKVTAGLDKAKGNASDFEQWHEEGKGKIASDFEQWHEDGKEGIVDDFKKSRLGKLLRLSNSEALNDVATAAAALPKEKVAEIAKDPSYITALWQAIKSGLPANSAAEKTVNVQICRDIFGKQSFQNTMQRCAAFGKTVTGVAPEPEPDSFEFVAATNAALDALSNAGSTLSGKFWSATGMVSGIDLWSTSFLWGAGNDADLPKSDNMGSPWNPSVVGRMRVDGEQANKRARIGTDVRTLVAMGVLATAQGTRRK